MKFLSGIILLCFLIAGCAEKKEDTGAIVNTQDSSITTAQQTGYYIDVHDLEPGKVSFADVEAAHQKDLATQDKYGVKFVKFWVDENKGKVYCLSQAPDEASVMNTHKEAHGLIPSVVYNVTDGPEAPITGGKNMYLDVHKLTPGGVTAKDVAAAHEKDLVAEKEYGVNFINYWVDEKAGVVMCLSEAPDSGAVKKTHMAAHGLMPAYVMQVKQGQ